LAGRLFGRLALRRLSVQSLSDQASPIFALAVDDAKVLCFGRIDQLIYGFVEILFRNRAFVGFRVQRTLEFVTITLQRFRKIADIDVKALDDNAILGQVYSLLSGLKPTLRSSLLSALESVELNETSTDNRIGQRLFKL
jgi:hypothetical protein